MIADIEVIKSSLQSYIRKNINNYYFTADKCTPVYEQHHRKFCPWFTGWRPYVQVQAVLRPLLWELGRKRTIFQEAGVLRAYWTCGNNRNVCTMVYCYCNLFCSIISSNYELLCCATSI